MFLYFPYSLYSLSLATVLYRPSISASGWAAWSSVQVSTVSWPSGSCKLDWLAPTRIPFICFCFLSHTIDDLSIAQYHISLSEAWRRRQRTAGSTLATCCSSSIDSPKAQSAVRPIEVQLYSVLGVCVCVLKCVECCFV